MLKLSRGGLTQFHGVLDHGLNLHWNIPLSFILIDRKESCMHKPLVQRLTLEAPAYCIMLLWSWQYVEAVCSMQLFCQTGQTRGNRVVG